MGEGGLRSEVGHRERLLEKARSGEDLAENGVQGIGREGTGILPLQFRQDAFLPGRIVDIHPFGLLHFTDLLGQLRPPVEKSDHLAVDTVDFFTLF